MNQALAVARKRSQQFKTKIKESADGGDGDGGDAHTARKVTRCSTETAAVVTVVVDVGSRR